MKLGCAARSLAWLLLGLAGGPLLAQETSPLARLYDTLKPDPAPLTEEAANNQTGWKLVPEDNVAHTFSGEAVLLNDKLAVVVRNKGTGPEVFAFTAAGWKRRASLGRLETLSGVPCWLKGLKIIENSSSAVTLEASFGGGGPAAMRFRLTTGEAILEIRPGAEAGFLLLNSKTRYTVVPDYFGDDMVFDALSPTSGSPGAGKVPAERVSETVCLPAENLCLNLLEGGESIVMSVWQSNQQEVWLGAGQDSWPAGSSAGAPAGLAGNRIRCVAGQTIWLAFLESPGLWHSDRASAKDRWTPPFPAKWRYDVLREGGLAASRMTERPQGAGGAVTSDGALGNAPGLVYPMDRSAATPLTVTCPTDVMRNTLGVGPCQYILACEGMSAQGDPTPDAVMKWVEKQFEQKKQKKVADDIQERLGVMTEHIEQARSRIQSYAEFSGQVRKVLNGRPGADSHLRIVDELDRFVAAGVGPSASPDRAKRLAGEVVALIGQENSLAACRRLGEELRAIGALQDGTLARCRMAVRRLWAQGQTVVANRPAEAALAREVQSCAERKLKTTSASAAKNGDKKP